MTGPVQLSIEQFTNAVRLMCDANARRKSSRRSQRNHSPSCVLAGPVSMGGARLGVAGGLRRRDDGGERPTVLHATEAGKPVYERMGYRVIANHTVFMEKRFLAEH